MLAPFGVTNTSNTAHAAEHAVPPSLCGFAAIFGSAEDMNLYEAIKGRRHYLPEQKAGHLASAEHAWWTGR